jgi:beta-N-acetylhexosaminidase
MLGPLMVGLESLELLGEERERLQHPAIGGVLLFARNYANPEQIQNLTTAIKSLRTPPLLIAVDQEGGRVQRFKDGLSTLPAAHTLGRAYADAPALALEATRSAGWLMAAELRALGIDLSFAPVLDIDYGISAVIGDRAFSSDPNQVAELALAWQRGARAAGMACVGKHFPGHGGTAPDSHKANASDSRALADLLHSDLLPFRRLINNQIAGLMMAHVLFPNVDKKPSGFSAVWINYLRKKLGFQGAIFSDDLQMHAAHMMGDLGARAQAVIQAGGDMAVLGNAAREVDNFLDAMPILPAESALRLSRLHGKAGPSLADLRQSQAHQHAVGLLAGL